MKVHKVVELHSKIYVCKEGVKSKKQIKKKCEQLNKSVDIFDL